MCVAGVVHGAVVVTTESKPTGDTTYTFDTIASPSANDYADVSGSRVTVLIANRTSGTPSGGNGNGDWRFGSTADVIRNGVGANNNNDTANNIIFGDPTLFGKIQFDLAELVDVTRINVYAWNGSATDRCRQAYTVWGSTASTAPAAGNTDDNATLASNGWLSIAAVPPFGGNDDQTASQITDRSGSLGRWRHLLLSMGDGISGADGGKTMYSEIDIHASGGLIVGERQFNAGNVAPAPIAAVGGDLLETCVASCTGENPNPLVRNGTTGTAQENVQPNPAQIWGQAATTYNLDTTVAREGYDITEIRLFSGWFDARTGQSYQIEVSVMDDPDFSLLGKVLRLDSAGSLLTRTYRTGGQPILSHVDAIRFVQVNNGYAGVGTVFREFDLIGAPTPNAEGTVFIVR